jgi:hypothetical protein
VEDAVKGPLIFIAVFALCQFLLWYSGVDMFERSGMNAYLLLVSLVISAFAWFTFWENEE